MSGSLDTSVLLRALVRDEPVQTKQALGIIRDTQSQLAVADVAFVEAAHVMQWYYHISRSDICNLITQFIRLEVINCNRLMLDAAMAIYVDHPSLSFEDCCLAVYAELNDAVPLYTFDKKLAAQTTQAQLI
ncbi:MAG: PIN domain-containing protein [Candidatus Saccharimonadales bacterium]